jgi:hypothetical protein
LQSNNNLNEGDLTKEQGSITSKAKLLEFPKNQEFFENSPFAFTKTNKNEVKEWKL